MTSKRREREANPPCCGVIEWNVLTAKWAREKPISIMSNTCPSSSNMVSISFILLRRFKQAQIFVNWMFFFASFASALLLFCYSTQSTYQLSWKHERACGHFIHGIAAANESNVFFLLFSVFCVNLHALKTNGQFNVNTQRCATVKLIRVCFNDNWPMSHRFFFSLCKFTYHCKPFKWHTFFLLSYTHMIFVTVNLLNQIGQPIKMSVCSSTLF